MASPVPQDVAARRRAQALLTLEHANASRLARAELKREVHAGERSIVDVLSPNHAPGIRELEPVIPCAASATIGHALTWSNRWGVIRARKLLADLRIAEHLELGKLTNRQRWAIIAAITGEVNPWWTPRLQEIVADARAQTAAKSTAPPAPPPKPPAPAALPDDAPEVLRVACPWCRSHPGQPCSVYEPVYDRWYEPKTPHGERFTAAGISRP